MTNFLSLALAMTVTQFGNDPLAKKESLQEITDRLMRYNEPWAKKYSETALAMLDASERAGLDKLKTLRCFRVEDRYKWDYSIIWKDGQMFVEPPRGVYLCYVPPLEAKPGKPLSLMKELAPLAEMRHVEKLVLSHPNVTDDMMDWLNNMSDLWHLNLAGTRITDAGLKKLAHMKRLRQLHLQSVTTISDAGFAALADLPSLDYLDLGRTKIGDRGVAALAKNLQLAQLHLDNTDVGDDGIVPLAGLSKLRLVSMGGTKITDKGLAAMAGPGRFSNLTGLGLHNTAITDAGLASLHDPQALPKLQWLTLTGSKVSSDGVAALKKARPGLAISE